MNQDAINKRIQTLEAELAGLKEELIKHEKFMFKYYNTRYNIGSLLESIKIESITNNYSTSSFNYRRTKTTAQADFKLQRELMCIGALAEQIDPYYRSRVIWDGWTQNYLIIFNNTFNKYDISQNTDWKNLGVVYMPKDVAEKVCKILNNKGVEL